VTKGSVKKKRRGRGGGFRTRGEKRKKGSKTPISEGGEEDVWVLMGERKTVKGIEREVRVRRRGLGNSQQAGGTFGFRAMERIYRGEGFCRRKDKKMVSALQGSVGC